MKTYLDNLAARSPLHHTAVESLRWVVTLGSIYAVTALSFTPL